MIQLEAWDVLQDAAELPRARACRRGLRRTWRLVPVERARGPTNRRPARWSARVAELARAAGKLSGIAAGKRGRGAHLPRLRLHRMSWSATTRRSSHAVPRRWPARSAARRRIARDRALLLPPEGSVHRAALRREAFAERRQAG
jgi:hypothetical protein